MISNIKKRIDVVDALRGFAIIGILLLHSIEHFNFYVFPDESTQPAWLNSIDEGVWDTLFFLFSGKAYAIFSILFGFTFYLMLNKQLQKGKDFSYRFLWRMLLLAGFAFINGLFFPGEVLLMYALVGPILLVFRKCKTKTLVFVAFIFLLQPVEWGHYIYYLLDNTHTYPNFRAGKLWGLIAEGQRGDSFLNLIKSNTLYGHKAGLIWAFKVGRLVQTAGLFILGFWIGKQQLFLSSERSRSFWKSVLIISALAFIPFYSIELNADTIFTSNIEKLTIFKAVKMYGNFAFTLVLISSFILLYKKKFFRKATNALRYCGKMSLTAYVFQSVLASLVFYGYGLGLGPSIRHTISLGVGIILVIIQIAFCTFWMKKFKQGPLEKLWHKLTWIGNK